MPHVRDIIRLSRPLIATADHTGVKYKNWACRIYKFVDSTTLDFGVDRDVREAPDQVRYGAATVAFDHRV